MKRIDGKLYITLAEAASLLGVASSDAEDPGARLRHVIDKFPTVFGAKVRDGEGERAPWLLGVDEINRLAAEYEKSGQASLRAFIRHKLGIPAPRVGRPTGSRTSRVADDDVSKRLARIERDVARVLELAEELATRPGPGHDAQRFVNALNAEEDASSDRSIS